MKCYVWKRCITSSCCRASEQKWHKRHSCLVLGHCFSLNGRKYLKTVAHCEGFSKFKPHPPDCFWTLFMHRRQRRVGSGPRYQILSHVFAPSLVGPLPSARQENRGCHERVLQQRKNTFHVVDLWHTTGIFGCNQNSTRSRSLVSIVVVSARNFRIEWCFVYCWLCCCLLCNIALNAISRSSGKTAWFIGSQPLREQKDEFVHPHAHSPWPNEVTKIDLKSGPAKSEDANLMIEAAMPNSGSFLGNASAHLSKFWQAPIEFWR